MSDRKPSRESRNNLILALLVLFLSAGATYVLLTLSDFIAKYLK